MRESRMHDIAALAARDVPRSCGYVVCGETKRTDTTGYPALHERAYSAMGSLAEYALWVSSS